MEDSRVDQGEQCLAAAEAVFSELLNDEPTVGARQQLRVVLSLIRDAQLNAGRLHRKSAQSELPL